MFYSLKLINILSLISDTLDNDAEFQIVGDISELKANNEEKKEEKSKNGSGASDSGDKNGGEKTKNGAGGKEQKRLVTCM